MILPHGQRIAIRLAFLSRKKGPALRAFTKYPLASLHASRERSVPPGFVEDALLLIYEEAGKDLRAFKTHRFEFLRLEPEGFEDGWRNLCRGDRRVD